MTLILIHGAYHGGWCWRKVVSPLRQRGVEVFTPTLTGLGERSHLLTPDVNLSTHIDDIVELVKFEDLANVALVGHSYAGMVISGVAEVIPERVDRLIYLDALMPMNGETVFDILPETKNRATETSRNGKTVKVISPPPPQAFGVEDSDDVKWVASRLTPMPYGCYDEPVKIANRDVDSIPKTFLLCKPPNVERARGHLAKAYEMAKKTGWTRKVLPGPHDIMVTHPKELIDALLESTIMPEAATVRDAIREAEKLLPGEPLPNDSEKDPRWQRIIDIGNFIQTNPNDVWVFTKKWGCHEQEDLRMAISTCLLEHLLEYHFDQIFPKIEEEIKKNPLFFDTFSHCSKFGQSELKDNSVKIDSLMEKYRR